jgi:hypothetical protein
VRIGLVTPLLVLVSGGQLEVEVKKTGELAM